MNSIPSHPDSAPSRIEEPPKRPLSYSLMNAAAVVVGSSMLLVGWLAYRNTPAVLPWMVALALLGGVLLGLVVELCRPGGLKDRTNEPKDTAADSLISNQSRSETKLQESEARFRSIFEQAAVGVVQVDSIDGKILRVNRRYCEIINAPEEELLGKNWIDLTHPDDQEQDRANLRRLREGEIRDYSAEQRLQRRDGSPVRINLTVSATWQPGEEASDHIAIVEEITERKQAEQSQRESEQLVSRTLAFQADVLNRVSDAVLVTNRTGMVTYANQAAEQLFQSDPADLRGRKFSELHDRAVVSGPKSKDILARLAGAGSWQGENEFLVEGEVRSFETSLKTFQPADSDGRFMVSVFRDISLRKEAERQRRQQLDALAHMTRLSTMGELVAGIAHEVKQPLHAISNYASAASISLDHADPDRPLGSRQLDNLKECNAGIQGASQRANEIIQGLRAFAQKSEKRRDRIDINQVIAGSIDLVAFETRGSRTMVETVLADRLPPLLADRVQIEQVVVNLLHNANEALKKTDSERRVVIRTIDAKSKVEVQIQDSGPGIPFDQYGKLFEAFYTTKENGLGMGLTISRTIIEDHGGRLWARNNSDAGVTFHFSLPADGTGENDKNGADRSKEF